MSEFSKNFMKWCGERSDTFIETGTFKGATTKLASKFFKKVQTVEINEETYKYTSNKLANIGNIKFYFGDTIEKFPEMITTSEGRITFWLDAHPMDPEVDESCPLITELELIKEKSERNDHIILIDDLQRCYRSDGDYPTFDELKALLLKINPDYHVYTLPFKAWREELGSPTIMCASTEEFKFEDKFYLNKYSNAKKYGRFVKSKLGIK